MTKQEETIQLIKDLLKYAEDHPKLSFWKCLSKFVNWKYIGVADEPPDVEEWSVRGIEDTDGIENDKVINIKL